MGAFFENLPAPNFPFALPPLAGYNVTVSNRVRSEMENSAALGGVYLPDRLVTNDYRSFRVIVCATWFEFDWAEDAFLPGLGGAQNDSKHPADGGMAGTGGEQQNLSVVHEALTIVSIYLVEFVV